MKKNDLDYLRQQISIVDVINNFIKLSKKGNNYIGLCPFHNDQHASLTVNEQKKIYKCFSCNASGDVFNFVKNYEHLNYSQAIIKTCELSNTTKYLSKEFNQQIIEKSINDKYYEINNEANKYFKLFLNNKENIKAKQYLLSRNINDEIIKKFEIGFAPNDKEIILKLLTNNENVVKTNKAYTLNDIKDVGLANINYDGKFESYFYNRITFPIYNEFHELVGFSARIISHQDEQPKYLNTATTKIFNKSYILYNLQNVINQDTDTIYILEGFMDVIALDKINVNNAVATMGVAFSKNHYEILKNIKHIKNIILCFDNDTAGKQAINKTAELLLNHFNVYIVKYLSNHKDIDELINDNKELAIKTINNIISYDSFIIDGLINNINNSSSIIEKNNLINETIKHLRNIKNEAILLQNINDISNNLKIDKESIFNLINSNKQIKNNKKKINKKQFEIPQEIIINDIDKNNHKLFKPDPIFITESQILKFCLYSKQFEEIFSNTNNKIENSNFKKIIDILNEIYFEHNEIDSFMNLDDKKNNELFNIYFDKNQQEIINELINEIKRKKISFNFDKVNEIIITHKKNILKKQKMNLHLKFKKQEINEDQYLRLLKSINNELKKINNKRCTNA